MRESTFEFCFKNWWKNSLIIWDLFTAFTWVRKVGSRRNSLCKGATALLSPLLSWGAAREPCCQVFIEAFRFNLHMPDDISDLTHLTEKMYTLAICPLDNANDRETQNPLDRSVVSQCHGQNHSHLTAKRSACTCEVKKRMSASLT